MQFVDRDDAGRQLAVALMRFKEQHPVVLALPRGGVPVGFEVAKKLEAPLDVVLVRKIGHPLSRELAIGAIAEGEGLEKIFDKATIAGFDIPSTYLDTETKRQIQEIELRRRLYGKDRRAVDIQGRVVLVVDDGMATGATMRAAVRSIRSRKPAKLILAVPVAPPSTIIELRDMVDEIVCLMTPEDFGAVGQFYDDFRPVSDDTVIGLLEKANEKKIDSKEDTE